MIDWVMQKFADWLMADGNVIAFAIRYPLQSAAASLVLLSIGFAFGNIFGQSKAGVPKQKSIWRARREQKLKEKMLFKKRMEMVAAIEHMPHQRQGIVLYAIANGEFVSSKSTDAQAMTLLKEGYLNAAGGNGTGDMVFTPPTWLVELVNTNDKALASVEKSAAIYKSEE